VNKNLIDELIAKNVKINVDDIVFITRDRSGQIIWLETGNEMAGLTHIVSRHADDYKKAFGIENADIPEFLEKVISDGELLSSNIVAKAGRKGYQKIYDYNGRHCIISGIGTNGYIVTAYPAEKE
jgi:hypothetical protein